jgi:hypothetical protein
MALGPDSIPALVRGLNKAAGIHASCPVGVIAGKLMNTLRQSQDPSWRQYALDHVGLGVSERAPHFQRLMAMRKSWLQGPAMPPQVAMVLEEMNHGPQGELMELMLALSDAPSDTVIYAIQSHDDFLATAAVLGIMQGQPAWPQEQRRRIAAALRGLHRETKNQTLRKLAADAIPKLVGS